MEVSFELLLVILICVTGVVTLFDQVFRAPKRKQALRELSQHKKEADPQQEQMITKLPIWVDYSRSLFPIFLIVLLIRSFAFEPFRIPSGSLEPTLLIGDFILVNKFDYGLRLPVLHTKILPVGEPKRGDIVVFRWPADPDVNYIKRVIGLPGDHIQYINKQLFINGQPVEQKYLGQGRDVSASGQSWPVELKREYLPGAEHDIFIQSSVPAYDFDDITVPEGYYFMMGDNRDDSSDSRFWGFVPKKCILGKASFVWLSWDDLTKRVRWDRVFHRVQ